MIFSLVIAWLAFLCWLQDHPKLPSYILHHEPSLEIWKKTSWGQMESAPIRHWSLYGIVMHNALTIRVLLTNFMLVFPYSLNTDTQHPAVLEQLPCGKLGKTWYFKYRLSSLLHHILLFRNVAPHPGNHSRTCLRAVSSPLQFLSAQKGAAGNGDAALHPNPECSWRTALTGPISPQTHRTGSELPTGFLFFTPGRMSMWIAARLLGKYQLPDWCGDWSKSILKASSDFGWLYQSKSTSQMWGPMWVILD